jgi:hypothetical protein
LYASKWSIFWNIVGNGTSVTYYQEEMQKDTNPHKKIHQIPMSSFRPKPKFEGIAQLEEKPQNFPSNEQPLLLCIEYNGWSTSMLYA